ncbi:MAG: hypothetical protein ACRYGF_11245 [Janthinobacterium lividum]
MSVSYTGTPAAFNDRALRKLLFAYLLLLIPLGWMSMRYDRYAIDGDAVSYMDIADLLHAHRWAGVVNGYWHPLYPALLWLAQVAFQTTHQTELRAYYVLNFILFLFQVVGMLLFVQALVRLRERMDSSHDWMLSQPALQLLGVSLLLFAIMRELSLGKVRTDGLLQALILTGLAMLMQALASVREGKRFGFASLMGLVFGFAYLTKSFAFLLALMCIAVFVLFSVWVQKLSPARTVAQGIVGLLVFGLVAGPYIAALSRQKHRLNFGDSGSLNYVWYVSGTEKMHLEPWMTGSFGSANVHLIHPEQRLLADPGVYSYKALPYGTYPPWFDATYFNERITPKFDPRLLAQRDARNVVLIGRYLVNHPEPLILLGLLLFLGATLRVHRRFAWPSVGLGLAMWAIYATVNVEERYVTVAYFAVLLPLFAALQPGERSDTMLRRIVPVAVVLLALLGMGELLRQDAANRRDEIVAGQVPAWRNAMIYGAAQGLARIGIMPGDEIACMGTAACIDDTYWARLAGTRILTEVYELRPDHLIDQLDAMHDREGVYRVVREQGARALVAVFDPGAMNPSHPAAAGWIRLGETNFYALPMKAH